MATDHITQDQDLVYMEEGMQKANAHTATASFLHAPAEFRGQLSDARLLASIMEEGSKFPLQKPQIQKVPLLMRQRKANNAYFEPAVVSIGPYHCGKKHLRAAEKLKARVAFEFVAGCPEKYYKGVSNVLKEAKECYLEDSMEGWEDDDFLQMMFLDGCFILHFMEDLSLFFEHLGSQSEYGILSDIILLENQLPFVVLQALMDLKYPEDGGEDLINSTLDFLLASHETERVTWRQGEEYLHLLQVTRSKFLSNTRSKKDGGKEKICPQIHYFRSATEIKAKGIHCKPSNKSCLTNVNFVSHFFYANLMLPNIQFDIFTEHVFLNMIAYETAPNTPNMFEVSTYIFFMDRLIDGVDDVKELRSQKLLHHYLSSDEEVVKIINNMGATVTPNFTFIQQVGDKIQKHYDRKISTWITQVVHDHFSTPWSIVAFFFAIFAIGLTTVQTYFAINPRRP